MPHLLLFLSNEVASGQVLLSGDNSGVNFFLSQVGCFFLSNKGNFDVM